MKARTERCRLQMISAVFCITASILFVGGCGNSDSHRYMVIDVSSGVSGEKYPVTYLKEMPQEGWGDEYKTSKIVLRQILPTSFKMGSAEEEQGRAKKSSNEKRHAVTLTKPYYVGVFEVTQKQWELVMGTRPSAFCRHGFYEKRPVENISYDMVRGSNNGSQWPLSAAVDSDGFIGRLRMKTGLDGFDLPTEAQWEYACRGSATNSALGCGINLKRIVKNGELTDDYKLNNLLTNVSDVVRCDAKDIKKPEKKGFSLAFVYNRAGVMGDPGVYDISRGTAEVGSFPCNSFGLFDMNGNVSELCLDVMSKYPEDSVVDPLGDEPGSVEVYRVMRGGSWNDNVEHCRSASRASVSPERAHDDAGFRVCYMEEPYKASIPVVVNKEPPKKISKLKRLALGEMLPLPLKDEMKYDEYGPDTLKSCIYKAYEDELSSEAKEFFLKPDWLLCVEIEVVPGTKDIYKIRIDYAAEDEDEAKAKADALAVIVQEDIGMKMSGRDHEYSCGVKDNWCKVSPSVRFTLSSVDHGRKSGVSQCARVELCDESLIEDLKAAEKESSEDARLPRSLVSILGIYPRDQHDGNVERVDGFFGKVFGDKIDSNEKNNVGARTINFDIPGEPLGFKEGVAFGSPKSHQTFMIRAVFSQEDIKGAYNAAKKLIEDVTGLEMEKGRGKTHLCRPKTSRGECMIEVIENDDGDRVFIDVTDLKLYELLEDERNADEFGFMPCIKKGQSPKEIIGIFGKELGCSVADLETETNDNNALVASFKPDENEFGFDAFRLFATPKTKKTFMIRAAYTGWNLDDKVTELTMKLKKVLGKSPKKDDAGDWYFIMPGGKQNVLIQVVKNGDVLTLDVTDFNLYDQYKEEK